ncbi:periplasmic chaperone for outer membrane proteins SurA [Halopseudomonas litoralis]|uniref:Chaperone SurA n=1 Tax=Halopseudomonas litoralis TaxID=797277 RepID=A0A1H1V511_9GAMM|nr:peptidylprolyl isomerase [Halopseudomonas litoralis]SDS79837.1 periplasmic chaperone for outer membrane proteins SurA [Halopseudomonas litoralis]
MHFKLHHKLVGLCAGLLLSTGLQAQMVELDRVAAIVDNDVVMQSQVQERLNTIRQQLDERGTELPPEDVLRTQVIDRLVLESIQLQMGERAGIRIDDTSLNQTMQQLAERNGVSMEQFRATLERDGISYNQAREQIRREMIINRVRQRRVAERIQVSDQEVRNFLNSEMGRYQTSADYRLAMIVLPVSENASNEEARSKAEIANEIYQELSEGADFTRLAVSRSGGEHALEGGELGWRKAAQLPPAFANAVDELEIGGTTPPLRSPAGFHILKLLEKRGGDNLLVDEFNVRHILIKPSEIRSEAETAQLIQRLYERIRAGESFETLARSFSEDPGSALNGGSLNWVTADAMVPEFREVMTTTPENQISAPFQSQFGWHILQVQGQRQVDMTDEMREQQARNLLQNRKFDEELQTWLLEIRDEAYVEIKS